MATATTYLSLIKPESTDTTVVRTIYNTNLDTIDGRFSADYLAVQNKNSVTITGELDMTGALACIDLNPAQQTTKDIISIIPTATLNATQTWCGININGAALDPSGVDAEVIGHNIDFSGVAETNNPEMHGLRINIPFGQDALHLEEGQLNIDTDLPSTAASEFTSIDIVIDSSALVGTSEYHAIDVATTGTPSGNVVAIGTHFGIEPLHQHIATFTTPSQTDYAGIKHTNGTVWVDGIDAYGVIFAANSDAIYVGADAQFDEIEVIMTTGGTKSIKPKFYYNTAADSWTEFFPADDTDGFQQSGEIRWEVASITATWTNDGDPGDDVTGYWIKIVRTRAGTVGNPDPASVKIGAAIDYTWDKDGDISVRSLVIGGTTAKGIEITGANTTAQLYIGGSDILANGEQAIYVNCPSEDGATNGMWISLGSTVTSGDLTGARIKVTTNATSGTQQTRGVYAQAIAAANDDAGLLQGGLFVADVSAGGCVINNVHILCGHYSAGATADINGDLYVGYLRAQTRGADWDIAGHDCLLALENEAVEGAGATLESAIRIFDTNVAASGFTYGIDLSDSVIATADIRLSNGETVSNTTDGRVTIGGGDLNIDTGKNYLINGTQISSANLSDEASIAMLDENETVTGSWEFPILTLAIANNYSGGYAPLEFDRSRDGDPTLNVSDDDYLGEINFYGYHTGWNQGASIKAAVDGDPGDDDLPTRMEFLTSPNGTKVPVLRLEIDNAGNIKMGDGAWTNYVNVSAAGIMTFEGSASITLSDVTMSLDSDADGDIYYRSSNKLVRLAKGNEGDILTMGAAVPEWAAP